MESRTDVEFRQRGLAELFAAVWDQFGYSSDSGSRSRVCRGWRRQCQRQSTRFVHVSLAQVLLRCDVTGRYRRVSRQGRAISRSVAGASCSGNQKENSRCQQVFLNIQRHEFEEFPFFDTNVFKAAALASEQDIEALSKIRRQFNTPEDINDDPEGAPSKRIERTVRGYRKAQHGSSVARKAGLEKIREECPRFHAWLKCLEGLNANIALN